MQHPEFTFKSKLLKKVVPYVFPPDLSPSDLAAAKVSQSRKAAAADHRDLQCLPRASKPEPLHWRGYYHWQPRPVSLPVHHA